jgi:hypothetical protein
MGIDGHSQDCEVRVVQYPLTGIKANIYGSFRRMAQAFIAFGVAKKYARSHALAAIAMRLINGQITGGGSPFEN